MAKTAPGAETVCRVTWSSLWGSALDGPLGGRVNCGVGWVVSI